MDSTAFQQEVSYKISEAGALGYTGVLFLYHHESKNVMAKWAGFTIDEKIKSATETILLSLIKGNLLDSVINVPLEGSKRAPASISQDSESDVTKPSLIIEEQPVLKGEHMESDDSHHGHALDRLTEEELSLMDAWMVDGFADYGINHNTLEKTVEDRVNPRQADTELTEMNDGMRKDVKGQTERRSVHAAMVKHKCSECTQSFPLRTLLRAHEKLHSRSSKEPYSRSSLSSNLLPTSKTCSICLQDFASFKELGLHRSSHFAEKLFQCRHCSKCFALRSHLVEHEVTHGRGAVLFKCPICSLCFDQLYKLKHHARQHLEET
ncbi:zinc finger protein 510-like isoform X2 [Watersipora subatra]|uniref:zinc finger protein 510-like isoform X2 n=1 Tax=Watersipora subatra TaxID=2589382 RepID=UPI00355B9891